jgi:hypothetical protein
MAFAGVFLAVDLEAGSFQGAAKSLVIIGTDTRPEIPSSTTAWGKTIGTTVSVRSPLRNVFCILLSLGGFCLFAL